MHPALALAARGADLLITTSAELHAPTAAEALGLPHMRLAYAPILPGDQTPPVLPVPELPPGPSRALWFAMNEGMMAALGRHLNGYRRRLGLRPARNMSEYLQWRCLTVIAVSRLLSPTDPGWSWRYRYTGYCFDDAAEEGLPDEVERFLADGPPPIYLGFGSINLARPERLARLLPLAVKHAGVRLLLSRGWQQLDVDLPWRVLTVGEVPHRALFPRLAGVCHACSAAASWRACSCSSPPAATPAAAPASMPRTSTGPTT